MSKISYSEDFLIFPEHCNHHKYLIFGGEFLRRLDLVAAHTIRRAVNLSDTAVNAVTYKVNVTFLAPSYLGDFLLLSGKIVSCTDKTITAEVTAYRQTQENKKVFYKEIAKGEFVFVTTGELDDLKEKPVMLNYVKHGLTEGDLI